MTTSNVSVPPERASSGGGPIVVGPSSVAVQRPALAAAITGGFWSERQRVNRTASVPIGIAQLDQAGNYDNLRRAAGEAVDSGFRGPDYMDSDLYKMLESAAYLLAEDDDPELRAFVDRAVELLEAAQGDDGYLNSRYQLCPDQRFTQLMNSHELYTAGHLFQAAVALSRGVGDDRLLAVARRCADQLVRVFLHERLQRLDGHPQVETALVELYRLTGESSYLDLARRLLDDRGHGLVGGHAAGPGYQQDALPVREMPTVTGHAVRAMYLEAGIVDVYLETADRTLLDSSLRRWDDLVATKTAITGGHGARTLKEAFGEGYELPSDQSYNETCAAVASVHWSWRLLLATGDARYADLIERTLYNVFAASVSLDGLEYFKGNPLQRRHDHESVIGDPRYRGGWFWSACCPPNVTRLTASLQHYLAAAGEDTVFLHQYVSARCRLHTAAGTVGLIIDSGLPFDGRTAVTVGETPAEVWTLALRIPSWSTGPQLIINGEAADAAADDGYLRLRRSWRPGDVVELITDPTPRLMFPHQAVDAVRGCVAVERGPLLYCFEQVDQPADIDVEHLTLGADASIDERPTADHPGIGPTVLLEAPATEIRQVDDGLPYRTGPDSTGPADITERRTVAVAVPYFQWANRDRGPMRVWLPLSR